MTNVLGSDPAPLDCDECGSAGAVVRGFCEVCYAEPGERGPAGAAADLPPAVLGPTQPSGAAGIRFSDVVAELSAIARLAYGVEDGEILAAACRRAEFLLTSLRGQFLADLGLRDARVAAR